MSTVISTFPHRSMISSAHQGKKKDLQTYNFKRICEAFIVYPVPHTTRMIEAAQNSLPLEGPGTRLANPSVHSDLSISEGKWRFYIIMDEPATYEHVICKTRLNRAIVDY